MTSSGAFATAFPIDDLLTEAWERIGKSPVILNAEVAESCRRSLQLLMIQWTNLRAPLWQIVPVTLTTVAGVTSAILPAQFADVMDIYVTVNGTDYIMGRVGRSDYLGYPLKKTLGRPTQVYVERQLAAPVVYLYPCPDAAYVVTAYCLRQPQDVTALTQTADSPLLWSEALASGLAARLAEKYAPERFAEKSALAQVALTAAMGESRQRVPLRIMPELC